MKNKSTLLKIWKNENILYLGNTQGGKKFMQKLFFIIFEEYKIIKYKKKKKKKKIKKKI